MKKCLKNISRFFCRIPFILVLCCFLSTSFAYAQSSHFNDIDLEADEVLSSIRKSISKRSALAAPEAAAFSEIPEKTKTVASLSFSWSEPVSMAAFKRDNHFWVVFDQRQNLDLKDLTKTIEPLGKDLVQIPHSKGTLLRFTPAEGVNFSVRKEGLLWILDIFKQEYHPNTKELQIFIQNNSINEPYLYIPTTTAGNIISFIDPEVGDSIIVATNTDPGVTISTAYSYPELDFLRTIQGVAIVPKASDLILTRGNSGLNIQALRRGMHISPNLDILKMQEMLLQTTDDIGSLNTDVPQELIKKQFATTLSLLEQETLKTAEEKSNIPLLNLAKYFIGKGMAHEALSILNKVEAEKDPITLKENFHGYTGVANFMAKRYEEAIRHFSYGKLTSVNEGLFWFTISSAALNFNKENNAVINSFISVIKNYPERIKEKIALIGAFNAIEAYDDISTQSFIDILKNLSSAERNQGLIDYLTAEKHIIQGYPRNALKEYTKAGKTTDLKFSALARFKAAILEYKLGLRTVEKTIEELERVKFVWSERGFKLEVLENLASLYIKAQDYYSALNTLKLAFQLAPEEKKPNIADRMVAVFEDIYVHNHGENIPTIKTISLYDDFDWLAAKSSYYNEIIQNLADRLVAVDLLDRAALILRSHLQNGNLNPVEKASLGARMALVDLMRGDNNDALITLDDTDYFNLPEALLSQRKIIRARALANTGNQAEALKLLESDYSKNAILLRTEIYWSAGRWNEASNTLRYLIETPGKDYTLTDEQANLILDWIVSLKRSNKETVIVRIRNKFTPYFKDTPYFSTFNVLTNTLDKDTVDLYSIDKAINEIKSFSNFSKIYSNILKDEPVKPIKE